MTVLAEAIVGRLAAVAGAAGVAVAESCGVGVSRDSCQLRLTAACALCTPHKGSESSTLLMFLPPSLPENCWRPPRGAAGR